MTGVARSAWLDGGSTDYFARLFRAGEHDIHRGVRITVLISDGPTERRALAKIVAALDLLHAVAPQQLARFPQTVHSIAVGPAGGAAACWVRDLRAVLL